VDAVGLAHLGDVIDPALQAGVPGLIGGCFNLDCDGGHDGGLPWHECGLQMRR